MIKYSFKELSDELRIGREIEFEFNDKQYSITNSMDGYWYLYCDTNHVELLKICEFSDKVSLINKISDYEIEELSIQKIFDSFLYNIDSLSIL